MRWAPVVILCLAGCAAPRVTHDADLELRVRDLEREIRQMRVRPVEPVIEAEAPELTEAERIAMMERLNGLLPRPAKTAAAPIPKARPVKRYRQRGVELIVP